MPKVKSSSSQWIKPYPELKLDGDKVFCRACSKTISSNKKFDVDQHVSRPSHQNAKKKYLPENQQTVREVFSSMQEGNASERNVFFQEFCTALISADIPFNKLENKTLKSFWEKHFKKTVPNESTLRKNYLDRVYNDALLAIKRYIGTEYFFIIVDETSDVCGRYIANILIGKLTSDEPSKNYLIGVRQLDKVNSVTIARYINETLNNFFAPKAVQFDKLLLILSDAAPYMIKAAENLKIFFPNVIHCTCVAHGINRVAEKIRNEYEEVNSLINNVKKIFLKSPLRIHIYKEKLPDVPLPPKPVITRWGTWLEAALFYADNFRNIVEVIQDLSEDSACITDCKKIIQSKNLKYDLAFIKAHFNFVSKTLVYFQNRHKLLSENLEELNNFQSKLKSVPGEIGVTIMKKYNNVIGKNKGLIQLKEISNIINGSKKESTDLDPNIIIACYKYAPLVYVDVERSFSVYKNVLTDKRQNFTIDNIEKYLISNCFHNLE